jgi:hypothetical protein
MSLHALPEGCTPLEALVVIKILDDEGAPNWCYRTTQQLNREELLGALVVHTELLRQELVHEWHDPDD